MKISNSEKDQIDYAISSILDINEKKPKAVKISFPTIFLIISKVISTFKNEPAILQVNVNPNDEKYIIVGDIHGDICSLVSIFKKEGDPSQTKYLFLGDLVDRGENSFEVIMLLYGYKCLYPDNIHIIRGNHEFVRMNDAYGFKQECNNRFPYVPFIYAQITETYQYIPICAILNDKIFCVHGGISDLITKREDLMKVRKVGVELNSFNQVQTDFLWNDPDENVELYDESIRGCGRVFGKNALDDFMTSLNFELVIRGHQAEMPGYRYPFGTEGRLLTVFSTADYCEIGNEAAYAKMLDNESVCVIKTNFEQIDSLEKTNDDDDLDAVFALMRKELNNDTGCINICES